MTMSIIGWLVIGIVAGFIANLLAHRRGVGIAPDVVLGIAGAVIGGWLFARFAEFGVGSLSAAVLGALLLLFISHGPDAGSWKTESKLPDA